MKNTTLWNAQDDLLSAGSSAALEPNYNVAPAGPLRADIEQLALDNLVVGPVPLLTLVHDGLGVVTEQAARCRTWRDVVVAHPDSAAIGAGHTHAGSRAGPHGAVPAHGV